MTIYNLKSLNTHMCHVLTACPTPDSSVLFNRPVKYTDIVYWYIPE